MKKKAAVLLSMALLACCVVPQTLSLADTPDKTEITEEENDQVSEVEEEEKEQAEEETKEEKKAQKKKEKETKAEEEEEAGEKEEAEEEKEEEETKAQKEEKKDESKPEDFRIRGKKLYSYGGSSKIARIPDNVEEIADEALMNNRIIEELYIPDSVKSVGFGAFSNMPSLKKVHLGNGFDADIVDIFLGSMNIESYETDEQSGDFYAEEGVLYVDSEIGTVAYYPAAKTDEVYTVPGHVSVLFLNGNRYIRTLTLSSTVKRIDFNGGMDIDIVPASLKRITVDYSNPYFYVDGSELKDRDSDVVVFSLSSAGLMNEEQ